MKIKPNKTHSLNVGGTVFEIDNIIVERFSESAFDPILSGRQEMEKIDGISFLERKPLSFFKMMVVLLSHPLDRYQQINFDEEV